MQRQRDPSSEERIVLTLQEAAKTKGQGSEILLKEALAKRPYCEI